MIPFRMGAYPGRNPTRGTPAAPAAATRYIVPRPGYHGYPGTQARHPVYRGRRMSQTGKPTRPLKA
eukprot:2081178-Rhodomonas_salina.2